MSDEQFRSTAQQTADHFRQQAKDEAEKGNQTLANYYERMAQSVEQSAPAPQVPATPPAPPAAPSSDEAEAGHGE